MTADEKVLRLVAQGTIDPNLAEELLDALGSSRQSLPEVAVLGSAVRLPGAKTPEDMWRLLCNARPVTSVFPSQRLDLVLNATQRLHDEYGHLRDSLESDDRAHGGWLTGIEEFEPAAFGMTDFEAGLLGPVERMLLELSTEAVQASCITEDELRGSRTGVFLAHQPDSAFPYANLFDDPDDRTFLSGIPANVAYRIAYTYDLSGPVMNVDTTCSSSLVAVHLARRALQLGECDMAIVAGLSLNMLPFRFANSTSFPLSPRHLCNAYDGAADGTVWGEGGLAIILKRRDDAERDGNPIAAGIVGSAVASDGTTNGMAAPSPAAHSAVVRQALAEAGLSASDIGYLEGHGAGTVLGDQVELDALTDSFRQDSGLSGFCSLGSVKTVLGHLKDASGLAGLLSALLRIQHRALPPLASLTTPAPDVTWETSPFRLDTTARTWDSDGPRRAGVSSLGISGTNAHVILEEYQPRHGGADCHDEPVPVLLSASSRWSLWGLVNRLASDLPAGLTPEAAAAAFSRRSHGPVRLAVLATTHDELAAKLQRLTVVRDFEQVPDTFYADGIFIADHSDATARSIDEVHRLPDRLRGLVRDFLDGADVSGDYRALTGTAPAALLPTAPFAPRRIWPHGVESAHDVSDLFFEPVWNHCPLPEDTVTHGTVLVIGDAPGLMEALCIRLAKASDEVVQLRPGPLCDWEAPNRFRAPLDDPAGYRALWQALGEARTASLTGIVFAADCGAGTTATDLDSVRESQRSGVLSLYALAKSLADLEFDHHITVASLTREAHPVGDPAGHRPERTTQFGLLRVVSQEIPHIRELCIDHDAADPDEVARHVVEELTVSPSQAQSQIAYRAGERLARTVQRQETRPTDAKPLAFRPGGLYVIAGGTGNLGPQLTRALAERGAGTVVLLSRTGLPARRQWPILKTSDSGPWRVRLEAIEQAEARGCSVIDLTCDITDPAAVASTFEHITTEYGRVDGGYMLTKQLFHLWIRDLDADDFRTGIENRVVGTWLLSEALRKAGAGHLVLFSSISSMSGTKGAGECAAVNQFLDSAAPYFTRRGLPTYTVNWPLILHDRSGSGARTPIPPIDHADFHAALTRFLDAPHGLDIVMRLDLAEAHYLRPVLRIPLSDALWEEAKAAAHQKNGATTDVHAAPGQPSVGVDPAEAVREAWQGALGTRPSGNDHFFAAGGSSLSVLRFVHLLSKSAGEQRITVADVYAYPAYEALVTLMTDGAPAVAEAEPETQADDVDALLARVERGEVSADAAAELLTRGGGA
ncbi:beta-ketoacyl synthase N-terminal-like domain-containing protein [Streptomyces sp. NPDC018045]|uniref:beta-ketoacyl synthase N-terminal-like domain-containing protein n=1 Tax=Streptomyces sp. NPDC018045 TaxID=3365037 RepID=UPI0037992B45